MQHRIRCAMAVALCAVASSAAAQTYQVQAFASALSSYCCDLHMTALVSQPAVRASASCDTVSGSALASATVDLPTATAALSLSATAPPMRASNAAGEAQFFPNFLFDVPDGLLGPNENLVVGVTLTVAGTVALSGSPIRVDYNLGLSDYYYGAFHGSSNFTASGVIEPPISGATNFVGTVEVHPGGEPALQWRTLIYLCARATANPPAARGSPHSRSG
jgi:hypothetical protein